MQNEEQRRSQDQEFLANHLENAGHGPQGIDKAPGEETSKDNVQFTQQTQKGKKIDADPSEESDQPIDQEEGL